MKRQLENKDTADEPEKKKIKINTQIEIAVDLPSELLETILSFIVDDETRRRLRLVSKKWLKMLNYTTFSFSPLLSSEISDFVSTFAASSSLFGLRIVKAENYSYGHEDLQHLSKLTQLTSLVGHFGRHLLWDSRPAQHPADHFLLSLTNLESLDVIYVHYETLNLLTKLRKLKASSLRNSISDPVFPVNLPNLQELAIYMADLRFFKHLQNIKHFTLLGGYVSNQDLPFTVLESLTLSDVNFTKPLPTTLTRLDMSNTPENSAAILHLTKLKHLEMPSFGYLPLHLFQNLEVCRLSGFNTTPELVEELLLIPRLRDLHIGLTDKANKCLNLIGSMTTLQALCLYVDEAANATALRTLTNLKSLTYNNMIRDTSFDWLKELTLLEELDLQIQIDRRLPLDSLQLTQLYNLTRLVMNQIGSYSPHCLTNFTKLLDLTLQSRSDDPLMHQFVGLSTLTQLTSLDVLFQTTDYDWQLITQLTNLKSLSEIEYVGDRAAHRLLDLTAMQKLTRFVSQQLPFGATWNFTALTSLQVIDTSLDNQVEETIREKLPYLEKRTRFEYTYL